MARVWTFDKPLDPTEGTCGATGKLMLTHQQALAKARWWRREKFARMTHYQCRSCGTWHVGNTYWKPKQR